MQGEGCQPQQISSEGVQPLQVSGGSVALSLSSKGRPGSSLNAGIVGAHAVPLEMSKEPHVSSLGWKACQTFGTDIVGLLSQSRISDYGHFAGAIHLQLGVQ